MGEADVFQRLKSLRWENCLHLPVVSPMVKCTFPFSAAQNDRISILPYKPRIQLLKAVWPLRKGREMDTPLPARNQLLTASAQRCPYLWRWLSPQHSYGRWDTSTLSFVPAQLSSKKENCELSTMAERQSCRPCGTWGAELTYPHTLAASAVSNSGLPSNLSTAEEGKTQSLFRNTFLMVFNKLSHPHDYMEKRQKKNV